VTSPERFRGALLGLASGDALGATLEFRPPGTFEPIDDMVGGACRYLGALLAGTVQGTSMLVVNLGDDADTTGAVYGQLAGALYGEDAIPAEWRRRLALHGTIERLADGLFDQGRAA
jgi:ADP-ribosylglycohydrolase